MPGPGERRFVHVASASCFLNLHQIDVIRRQGNGRRGTPPPAWGRSPHKLEFPHESPLQPKSHGVGQEFFEQLLAVFEIGEPVDSLQVPLESLPARFHLRAFGSGHAPASANRHDRHSYHEEGSVENARGREHASCEDHEQDRRDHSQRTGCRKSLPHSYRVPLEVPLLHSLTGCEPAEYLLEPRELGHDLRHEPLAQELSLGKCRFRFLREPPFERFFA